MAILHTLICDERHNYPATLLTALFNFTNTCVIRTARSSSGVNCQFSMLFTTLSYASV